VNIEDNGLLNFSVDNTFTVKFGSDIAFAGAGSKTSFAGGNELTITGKGLGA